MGELAWKQQVTSSESFSGNFWRILFPEGCLRVHQLCQYLSCGGWSKRLLSDYFVDGLGGGGFPHRQDVSDSALGYPGREAVFCKGKTYWTHCFWISFHKMCTSLIALAWCERVLWTVHACLLACLPRRSCLCECCNRFARSHFLPLKRKGYLCDSEPDTIRRLLIR